MESAWKCFLQKITEELDTVVSTLNAVLSSGDSPQNNMFNAIDQGQGDSKIWEHEIGTYQMVSANIGVPSASHA